VLRLRVSVILSPVDLLFLALLVVVLLSWMLATQEPLTLLLLVGVGVMVQVLVWLWHHISI